MAAMNEEQVRKQLRKACADAGTQRAWATQAGVSAQYVSAVLKGTTEPGGKLLDALGIVRVIRYERVKAQ